MYIYIYIYIIYEIYYSPEIRYILSDAGSKQRRETDSFQRNAKTAIQIVMINRWDVCLRQEGIDLAFSWNWNCFQNQNTVWNSAL
jgi:hypothetical protein